MAFALGRPESGDYEALPRLVASVFMVFRSSQYRVALCVYHFLVYESWVNAEAPKKKRTRGSFIE
jgi:hypothetical protein